MKIPQEHDFGAGVGSSQMMSKEDQILMEFYKGTLRALNRVDPRKLSEVFWKGQGPRSRWSRGSDKNGSK